MRDGRLLLFSSFPTREISTGVLVAVTPSPELGQKRYIKFKHH